MIQHNDHDRIAIIGAGHVGSTAAYALMLRALVREIVLIDSDIGLAEAEAIDISDANALARPARIWAGDYADAATARLAIITAGAATHGSESRLSVAGRSAKIVGDCVDALIAQGFDGILIIASNPVDVMAHLAFSRSGLSSKRVIGIGTLLDSSRLQQALASRLNVAPGAIEAVVVGEHGDSEVAAFSTVRIGGVPLDRFAPNEVENYKKVADDVRTAGYRIIEGKGYTSFGVATAIVRICEAILRDEHSIVPVSTLLTGEFGLSDIYLSLPCVLGAGGVDRALLPELNLDEIAHLRASGEKIALALAELKLTGNRSGGVG
ncbi:MAG: L-lactate dehydrogenase [Sphingorhabdus sp.]